MSIDDLLATLALVAALAAALTGFLAWRAAGDVPLRLAKQLERVLANERAEAETTRATLAATEGRLTAAIQAGTTEALRAAFGQLSAATQATTATLDGLRRQAAEDSHKTTAVLETRLAAIQNSVDVKLHEAVERQMNVSFARVLEQFAQVQQAMGEVQSAAAQIGDLKRLFSNVKSRGGWGEAQLGGLLEQILPPGSYERNYAISPTSRERVDFALRMPARELLWLPVDAKFPTEDYERLLQAAEAGDIEGERAARDGLAVRLRLESRKIREKYIHPPETVEFAVLYLPSDGLFAEVARIPGLIDDVRSREKIIVLGPTLLPALLQTIHLGHITLDLEKRAGEIGKLLGATRLEMKKMDDVLEALGRNASAMSNNIERARTRTRAMERVLRNVEMADVSVGPALLGLSAEDE